MEENPFPGTTLVQERYRIDGIFCPIDDSFLYVVSTPDESGEQCGKCGALYSPRATDEKRKTEAKKYLEKLQCSLEQKRMVVAHLEEILENGKNKDLIT